LGEQVGLAKTAVSTTLRTIAQRKKWLPWSPARKSPLPLSLP
jgi:hypothetical protein